MDKATHIVQSAQILFAQFGLRNVTTDDIAREARVSKATIYKHFDNKTDIFDRVVNEEAEALLSSINEAVAKERSAVAKLRAHLTVRLGRVHEFVNFYRVTRESWGDFWPHIAKVRNDFLEQEHLAVKNILEEGVEKGELKVDNSSKSAYVLILALASAEYQWFLDEGRFSLADLMDTMLTMMINGIGHNV